MPDAGRDHGALLLRGRLHAWLALRNTAARAAGTCSTPVIAAYWPLADEPDLRPLLSQWSDADITVALPVVVRQHAPLAFRVWTPQTVMAAGAYGIAEPQGTAEVVPDILLVPTLGYTDDAYRLGYGGGYYDRTLAALQANRHPAIAIGIAWAGGRIASTDWTPAAHDVPLNAILTPDGWTPAAPV